MRQTVSVAILLVSFIDCAISEPQQLEKQYLFNVDTLNEFKCIGHRGLPLQYPENTYESFEAALELGADGIELDVHMSSDGYVVLMHDDELDRTVTGRSGFVWDHSLAELEQMRISFPTMKDQSGMSILEVESKPSDSRLFKIPLFKKVLQLLQRYPKAIMYIDIKPSNPLQILDALHRDIVSFKDADLTKRLIFGVWRHDFMERLVSDSKLKQYRRSHNSFSVPVSSNPNFIYWQHANNFSLKFSKLNDTATGGGKPFIERIKATRSDGSAFTWTVNDEADMWQAARLGVDAIMTDDVGKCLAQKARYYGGRLEL